MKRVTPSQVVSVVAVVAGIVLSVLQANSQLHTPAWVFAVLTALVSICRSLSPSNSGGKADTKATAVHSAGGAP